MASDASEITHLLKRERYHRDTAQWTLCRDAYHPDPQQTFIDVSWFQGDIDAFLQRSAQVHPGRVNVVHSAFDPVDIRIRGPRATSEAFCTITSGITLAGVDYELASYMRLVSRLQKLSDTGAWRIVRLEAIYVRDRLVCCFPGADAAAPLAMPDEVRAYPRPYRHMAFVMLNRGLKPRVDLPHEDDQESVRRVLEGNAAFLEGAGYEAAGYEA
ncbi:uncharacterized protein DSM5745_00009 [Aspergillus mulundensis]|uniref:SnoaL-like domain-containing protein n=1 Tax=Aspergillus mulundensis TaxID=1810919 RepID=A0A3D8T281_9EURO|nr:Uncharacterized protein DSM5745_00009 [Aspergillus mulundensis]RDW92687.1 Uncharacterized protein DSM5745_00009 [Aspergillus mulundensis]